MSGNELCALSLSDVSTRIAARDVSPVEVTEATLARIERVDERLNAYITVMADEAMETARAAEAEIARGAYRGPLHGVPISLKDLLDTRGVRMTAGARVLADHIATDDADTVRRLRGAGAVLVGKANMLEFAYGEVCADYGPSRNPWNTDHGTSGSSSGSAAAVAAGLCYGSLGSDTGGSIRLPAAWCGIVGLKPTYDLVSRAGAVALSWSLDHIGPMTRTVRDCALLLDAIVAHDPGAAGYAEALDNPRSGLRVGIVAPTDDDGVTPDVRAQIDAAVETIRAMGFETQMVALPHPEDAVRVLFGILYAEASSYHLPWLNTRPDDYSPNTRERLELGALLPATVYLRAQRVRRVIVAAYRALFADIDLLVMPTAQTTASRVDGPAQEPVAADGRDRMTSLIRFTGPFDVTGFPAISVPCGLDPAGLPVGIQFVARPYEDGLLLQFAHTFEQAVAPRLSRPGGDSLVV